MTDNEINMAVAEACGWTSVHYSEARGTCSGYSPGESCLGYFQIPDYANDLNACREVWASEIKGKETLEDIFTIQQGVACGLENCGVDQPNLSNADIAIVSNATARQRCEAFLKMMGKWKENQNER